MKTKNRPLLIGILLLMYLYSTGKTRYESDPNINDCYYMYVDVTEDSMYFIDRVYPVDIPPVLFEKYQGNDTFAACRIEKFQPNIIRAYSDLLLRPIEGMKYERDTCYTDTCSITLTLPSLDTKVKVSILIGEYRVPELNDVVFTPRCNSHTFYVPKKYSGHFYLTIRDLHIEPSAMDGSYYGIAENPSIYNALISGIVSMPEFDLRGHNVKIELPNVNKNLFNRWYFNGDFIYITDDEILWKNHRWIRENSEQNNSIE